MAGLKAGVVACSHLPKTLVNGGVPECVSVGLGSYLGDPGTPAGPVWCPWRGLEGQVLLEDLGSGARHRVVLLALAEL